MIGWLLLIAMQAAHQTVPPAPIRAEAIVPANWQELPELRFRRRPEMTAELSAYVRDEVRAGHCIATRAADGSEKVEVPLIVLAAPAGSIRRIVPRAIGCPTVEQYATGLVERMARDNLDLDGEPVEAWYHTSLAFTWRP